MSQSIVPGGTNYSHQPLEEIRDDIGRWLEFVANASAHLERLWTPVRASAAEGSISYNLTAAIEKSRVFFESASADFQDVLSGIDTTIEERHVRLLKRIGEAAWDLEQKWGTSWHQEIRTPRYGEANYRTIEEIYREGRQTCIDLLDCMNAAERLEDFVGRSNVRCRGASATEFIESVESRWRSSREPSAFRLT